jgi:hypothetical protein
MDCFFEHALSALKPSHSDQVRETAVNAGQDLIAVAHTSPETSKSQAGDDPMLLHRCRSQLFWIWFTILLLTATSLISDRKQH